MYASDLSREIIGIEKGSIGVQGGAIGMSPQGVGGNAPQLQVVDSLFLANTAVNGAGAFVQR